MPTQCLHNFRGDHVGGSDMFGPLERFIADYGHLQVHQMYLKHVKLGTCKITEYSS